jgi:hypothetical protein
VLVDVGCCVVAEWIPHYTLEQVLQDDGVSRLLETKMRARSKRWGVHVDTVGLIDKVPAKAYRLFTEGWKP